MLGLGLGLDKSNRMNFGTAPSNTVAPGITGTLEVGQTLTCSTGTWTGTPTITYSYQWKRGVTNIGTNSATYVAVYADISENITCTVTATNVYGSASQVSNTVVILLTLQAVFNNHAGRNQWAAENSTIVSTTTTWLDYASVHNVANPAAGNQPTRVYPDTDFNNKKTGSFDGTDDYLIKNTANYGSGQTTGSLWIVVKTGSSFTSSPAIFSVNNIATTTQKLLISINTAGKINITTHNGTTANVLIVDTALTINSKYIIEVESNGSTTSCYVNGVLQTLTGTNSGLWFDYANTGNTLDNVVIGGAIRASSPLYYFGKIALVGNYPLLTAGNRSDLETKLKTFFNVY